MGVPTLGAALIVKNEQRVLARCLSSIEPVVDEIVVVDTGSTDDSVSIARSFGATVLFREWDGDFSAARNFGLDHMRSQWILYIDADEYLAPAERTDVQRWLADPEPRIAYRLLLRSRVGFTPYREYRIWRNHPDVRFWGVIHESHLSAIAAVAEREQLSIGDIDLLLEHDGYEGDQAAKGERNLPLLLAQVELDPDRSYLWDHIGRIQSDRGHHDEAREAWERGRRIILRRGTTEPSDALIYFDLIHANVAEERSDPSLVEEADMLFPDNVAILWAGVRDAEVRRDFAEVVERIDRLMSIDPEHAAAQGVAVDERLLGESAYHLRGLARFHMGDHSGALRDFAAAEACDPTNAEYRVKRQLAEIGAQRLGELPV
jgi:glycosyltransferase involved in cell wall biosynthesis